MKKTHPAQTGFRSLSRGKVQVNTCLIDFLLFGFEPRPGHSLSDLLPSPRPYDPTAGRPLAMPNYAGPLGFEVQALRLCMFASLGIVVGLVAAGGAPAHAARTTALPKGADAARTVLGDSPTGTKPTGNVRAALTSGVKRLSNVEYTNPGSGALLLDLYLPATPSDRLLPVVLWIHGGGWKSGSKDNCPLTWLAAEGYAVVSLGYRLSLQARWPAQLEDARAAIRWLRSNAARYQLDAQRLAVAGASSGANLAGVVGTAPAPGGESVSSRVSAVIDFYGTSDVLTLPVNVPGPGKTETDLANSNGAKLLGGIVRDRPELARAMSPLYQVSYDDPPFLIVHGDQDLQVPLEQSTRLHAKLKETGVSSELKVLPGAGHGGKPFDAPEVRETILRFLRRLTPQPPLTRSPKHGNPDAGRSSGA